MRTTSNFRPGDFIKPHLPEARIQRMWSFVELAQSRAPVQRVVYWGLIGPIAAVACMALVLWLRPWFGRHGQTTAHAVTSGDTFATEAKQRQVTLPDGSVLSMGTSTRIEVVRVAADGVRLRLIRGALTCDVPRVESRQFVVQAGSADVTVKGTRFTVELEPEATAKPELSVSVDHGRVQLRLDGHTVAAILESGQKWSSQKAAPELPTVAASSGAPPEPEAPAAPSPAPSSEGPARPLAVELMTRANAARLGGNPAEAARAYAQLRDWYPRDARAGLAAFELGRIRLNNLGNARGALEAFRFALAHPSGGFFSEDAEVGVVEAFNRLGDAPACVEAREAFLEHHANSAHAARVRQLCAGR